jgi:hypothetical protein
MKLFLLTSSLLLLWSMWMAECVAMADLVREWAVVDLAAYLA